MAKSRVQAARVKRFGACAFALSSAMVFVATQFRDNEPDKRGVVRGISMEPTFHDGETVHLGPPENISRGSVVQVEMTENSWFKKRTMLKRIVGLPGETLLITPNEVWLMEKADPVSFSTTPIYDEPPSSQMIFILETTPPAQRWVGYERLAEPYIRSRSPTVEELSIYTEAEKILIRDVVEWDKKTFFFHVPPNQYLVLGDNRGGSADSRIFGPIHKDKILGIAND